MSRRVEDDMGGSQESPESITVEKVMRVRMDVEKYYRRFGITNPSHLVVKCTTPILIAAMRDHFRGRILDIGCGSKSKELLADSNVEEYVGLDHESSPHDNSRVDLSGDAYEIPSAGQSFDGVLCTAVLEHLEEPKRALVESHRVLKRGGSAIYTIPLFWHLHEEPRDFYRYSKFGIIYLFEAAGYEIVELRALSGFWITFASALNYYLQNFALGPLKLLVGLLVALSNLIVPVIDRLDRRFNPQTERWTWCYLVVARKN